MKLTPRDKSYALCGKPFTP